MQSATPDAKPVKPVNTEAEQLKLLQLEIDLAKAKLEIENRMLIHVEDNKIELARQDPNHFIEFAFDDPTGKPLKQSWFHREWQDHFTRYQRVVEEAPRDHGKSTQVIGRTIWEIGKNPNIRMKFVCQSDAKARERLSEVRAHVTRNERVRRVFPGLFPADDELGSWNKSTLTVNRAFISKDPTLQAHGITSSGTGGRADVLIFDDVCDLRNTVMIPALRETVKRNFFEVYINLLPPEGRAWYIATPWHTADLTHDLRKHQTYKHFSYAIDEKFTPIWREVWPKHALKARYYEIGRVAFNRGYRLKAVTDDDLTFPSFRKVMMKCRGIRIRDIVPVPQLAPRYAGVDLSTAVRKGNVIYTLALLDNSKRVPVDIEHGAWKSPETAARIIDSQHRNETTLFNIENNALQEMLVDWLKEMNEPNLNIQGFHTGSQKADPAIGLPSIEVELQNDKWIVPCGEFENHELECDCGWCVWREEMLTHPLSKTTDHVMAMWFAREAAREGYRTDLSAYVAQESAKSVLATLHDQYDFRDDD